MRITAVLLAGGKSRRMGRDKATIEWRGRPLWEWQIEKLRALRAEKIFLSTQSDVPWRPADVELLLDAPPSRGPLSGLVAALASTEADHLLTLAVDMPFMSTEHLRLLCGLAENGMGVIPMIDRRAEPLSAIYPKEAHTVEHVDIRARIARRDGIMTGPLICCSLTSDSNSSLALFQPCANRNL